MAIKLVRKPSDTPNINNIDDIVGLRYAYGNQNGYVIDKGNEISHSVNGSTFRINSGRLVLQGVEVDIDANGIDLTVDNFATKQFYSVYLTVNLALNTVQIQFTVDTAGFPEIDPGDDLTKNTSGIARLELYRFTAQSGLIGEVNKVVQSIKYVEDRKVADSSKINNLELMQDKNGILKIGNIIIPQKKLLWEGSVTNLNPSVINLSEKFNDGDIFEIHWHINNAANNTSDKYISTVVAMKHHSGNGGLITFAPVITRVNYSHQPFSPEITFTNEMNYFNVTTAIIGTNIENNQIGSATFVNNDMVGKIIFTKIYKIIQ